MAAGPAGVIVGLENKDNDNWLARLSAEELLAAAANELLHCQHVLERRNYRAGVTHARRAAGMACNAILRIAFDASWGRSYMDHVIALAEDLSVPETAREAARLLVETQPAPPELVTLGKPNLSALNAAQDILNLARLRVAEIKRHGVTN